jgi:hypothetical protein
VSAVYVDGAATHLGPGGRWSARITPARRGPDTVDVVAVDRSGASGDAIRSYTYAP